MRKMVYKHPPGSSSLESESTRQTHDVVGVNLGFERSQLWQIVPVDINERCIDVHVISVQRRGVIGEQSLCLGNGGKAIY